MVERLRYDLGVLGMGVLRTWEHTRGSASDLSTSLSWVHLCAVAQTPMVVDRREPAPHDGQLWFLH